MFQKDIFPDTASDEPALTADEWMEGKIAEPKTFSLEGGFKAKEKGSTSIGKKNAMAGLSSSKVDKSGSSASVSNANDFTEDLFQVSRSRALSMVIKTDHEYLRTILRDVVN